ncbi:hypothetical protein VTN49DRAFT_4185 [Thermomyces lanuginosus]|uniref:uncharacterized protein n=1 Tax=Thermomyces lanuginosus TaxID=5541 RepID=UPI0037442FFB
MTQHKGKAIHFGGGNIGRGFVAEFLHDAGYEVVFIDVVDKIIEALNSTKEYKVTEISEEGEITKTVTDYRAINSKEDEGKVIDEIATGDIVTCAVGPKILQFIAPVIAKGIDKRQDASKEAGINPIAVIACENAIGATDTLREYIEKHTPEDRRASLENRARFANSAIDRIVPNQPSDAGLNVLIEKFYEWVVEKKPFGEYGHPDIPAIKWVDDLQPYIERKLFTVNTGHATAAYYGYNAGKETIHDALNDENIRKAVQAALEETASLIVAKHDTISEAEQKEYVDKIVKRISNKELHDNVVRVGRAPLRKLSRNERFIGPASQLAERGLKYDALLGAIEQALRFQNVKDDDESAGLANILKTQSAEDATKELTGLETSHPLYKPVLEVVQKVQIETH